MQKCLSFLGILLLILKGCEAIDWSMWVITAPFSIQILWAVFTISVKPPTYKSTKTRWQEKSDQMQKLKK